LQYIQKIDGLEIRKFSLCLIKDNTTKGALRIGGKLARILVTSRSLDKNSSVDSIRSLRERDHWGDPDVDGRIILRWIFRKWERLWSLDGTGSG
jgi:hypothetical protein